MTKRATYDGLEAFFERPTRDALEALVESGVGETDQLDFKEDWVTYPNLARHVLAIGNSGGGAVVFGVREEDDGTFTSVGLSEVRDPANISQGLAKFLPPGIELEPVSFPPREKKAEGVAGRAFQVLFVDSDVRHLPLIARAEGKGIDPDVVYVRRGTQSVRANHDELERLINRRIESGYSSTSVLELEQHLEQLRTLHQSIPRTLSSMRFSGLEQAALTLAGMFQTEPNPLYPDETFEEYVSRLIPRKKRKIERVLELDD